MKRSSIPSLFLVWAVWSVDGIVASMTSPVSLGQAVLPMRGGASPSGKKSKKSSTKTKETSTSSSSRSKEVIAEAMKEKDAAEALGDAIRDRADILREEDPLLKSIDESIGSVGQALGTSDSRQGRRRKGDEEDGGGGVEVATSSVIAHYFLQSHGGAHALQCLCSALATLSGLGAMTTTSWKYTLLQRTFLFAMLKHVSGLLAAAALAAKAIPKIGLSQARVWMEKLVVDPVSQYVFFNALLLVWLPGKARALESWWWKQPWIIPLLLGPILLREIISCIMVLSDVLVLWSVGGKVAALETVLKVGQSVVNAIMSLLVTPTVWRSADPAQRQAILSKLVGRVSLVLEVAIGAVLGIDAAVALLSAAFASPRPSFKESLTRLLCIRFYIHFLWVRRSQIRKVGLKIRGGASKVPFYILDILQEPTKAMGIERPNKPTKFDELSWWDVLAIGLGLSD